MGNTFEQSNFGRVVLCDLCNADHTFTKAAGGFLFQSKGVCPTCAPKFEESIKKYNEEEYIKARAKEGETFSDFIYRIRQEQTGTPDAIFTIQSFDNPQDAFDAMFPKKG